MSVDWKAAPKGSTGAVTEKSSGKLLAWTINEPWQDSGSFDVTQIDESGDRKNFVGDSYFHQYTRKPD